MPLAPAPLLGCARIIALHLPKVSVDHLGLSHEGLAHLLRLVEGGTYVKATGFSRGDLDVRATFGGLAPVNPARVMFGTNLPSTRAPRPFSDDDINLVVEAVGDDVAAAVPCDNALGLYHPLVDTPGD